MTQEIIDYATEALMKADSRVKNQRGFRAIHVDFINNDKSEGLRVTYDDTPDVIDPRFPRTEELRKKLMNKQTPMTMPELLEFLRIVLG